MHAMEAVIERLLRGARRESPVFWTHAHRYVASDSVWCENSEATPSTFDASTKLEVPDSLHAIDLKNETILAPDLKDVLFPGNVLTRCAWPKGPSPTLNIIRTLIS